MPAGRPTKYCEELVRRIVAELGEGKTISMISKEDWCPTRETINKWKREKKEFSDLLLEAHLNQADAFADQLVDISDNEDIEVPRAQLMIGTRKWLAAKRRAEAYGDSTHHKVSAPDGGAIQINHEIARKRILFALNEMKHRPPEEPKDA